MLRYLMLVSLVFIAATPRSETAQESSVPEDKASFSGATILALHNGLNRIDLLGDGKQGIVFVARRENFNPHGHSSITFYIRASASSAFFSMPVAWHIVPFFGQTEEDYTELLQTVQGADCTLADLRLIRTHRSGPARVMGARSRSNSTFTALRKTKKESRVGPFITSSWNTLSDQSLRTVTSTKLSQQNSALVTLDTNLPMQPNHSMQPTPGRRTTTFLMTQSSHSAATQALASGG